MAGALSFELSSGTTRFIANCGVPESNFRRYAPFARATAAHTTATVNNDSSSRFANESKLHALLPSPLIRGPEKITVSRKHADGFQILKTSHDGYLHKYGIIHRRELYLADDGETLNGQDSFNRADGSPVNANPSTAAVPIVLRFHLPHTISASLLSSGHSILIATPDNDAWTFTCVDGKIALEESVQFAGPGLPRKSEQIVVTIDTYKTYEVRWTLIRRKKKPAKRPQKKKTQNQAQNQAMPDLLDALKINRKD